MAYDVTWSPEAIEDVEEIAEFIARVSPRYASAVVDTLLDAARKLSPFPFAGRIVPEVGNERIREKFVLDYRLIYRVYDEGVIVLAVIHGRRLFPFEIR